ncbi:MAG: DUF4956 domain-containing protein [Sedimentibacter saalensis]|uniref:DUF4956 domain-containing protein n=1 Tax=Sedimentibacter saalensis TaxID=130788 RepID=UPI00315857E9
MFTSILTTTTEALSVTNAIVCMVSSLALGIAIALTYMYSKKYTKNFVVTLVLMPLLVQLVIMMVNGNLGTGVAVMGAFSLVRFRSVPGSSKEISFIFFAMAVGIATGMGFITFAAAATAAICLVFMALYKSGFGDNAASERSLKITIPENLDYTNVFDDLFEKYLKSSDLLKVKTTNLGSMFELHYDVVLKNLEEEKALLDDIRCRNGNLTIICSRKNAQNEEL